MENCKLCNRLLPLTEYYKDKKGLRTTCKECCKAKYRQHYQANKERLLKHNKQYAIANKDKLEITRKVWRDKNKDKVKAYQDKASKKYRDNNKDKERCYNLVKKAIRQGVLIKQPCIVCNSLDTETHHSDYNQPLSVVWVCRSCHFKLFHS